MSGRPLLYLICGFGIGIISALTLWLITPLIPYLDMLSENSYVTYETIGLYAFGLPIIFIFFFQPDALKVNIKCEGILHDEYVEILKGNKIITQRYEDIKHLQEVSHLHGDIWLIGEITISSTVGTRKRFRNSNRQKRCKVWH